MRSVVGAVALLLVCIGCADPPAPLGAQCDRNVDCQTPFVCSLGRCRVECANQRDCPIGSICLLDADGRGVCRLGEEAGCGDDDQCVEPLVCRDGCTQTCSDDQPCARGAVCMGDVCENPSGAVCTTSRQCMEGYFCRGGRCWPPCAADRDCDPGFTCVDAACEPIPGEDAGPVDAGVDAPVDAPVDSPPDMGIDAGVDSGTDATTDAEGMECVVPGDCTAPDVVAADCVSGFCQIVTCASGRASCDDDFSTGCEQDILTDPDNCGLCAGDCGLGGVCTAGVCDTVVDVAVGHENTCVTRSSGAVYCAGQNVRGEAGVGMTGTLPTYSPLREVMTLTDATSASVGYALACATRSTGGAVCMGNNAYGQIGSGSTSDLETLPDPVSGLTDVVRVFAGGQRDRGLPSVLGQEYEGFACALRTGGAVSCWGSEYGRGDGMTGDTNVPVAISGATDVIDLSAGRRHACLVRSGGEVACWGRMGARLGTAGVTTDLTVPTAVAGISDAIRVDAGQVHTCAVRSGGQVVCWGDNANNELGADSTTTPTSATPVAVPVITNAVDVDIGPTTSCALGSGGEVWCWGSDGGERLGDGPGGSPPSATPILLSGLEATALAVGQHALCVIRTDGAVACWGVFPREIGLFDFSSRWAIPTVHPEFPPTPTP